MQPASQAATDAMGLDPIEIPDEPLDTGIFDHCRTHGISYPKALIAQGVTYRNQCPRCTTDQRDEEAAASSRSIIDQQRASHAQRKRAELEARFSTALIPLRYRTHRLATFPVERIGGDIEGTIEGCRSYLNNWERNRKNGTNLIIVGGPGRGKTGLACSIANAVIENHHATAIFITAYGAVRHQRDTWGRKGKTESQALADLTDPDLLILDDVGAQVGTDLEMLMLFELLNARYSGRKPTIFLSNLPIEDREDRKGLRSFLGQRIMDRMLDDGAMVLACNWKSLRGNP